jgi:cobalt-zinc-cadmium efflux system protein
VANSHHHHDRHSHHHGHHHGNHGHMGHHHGGLHHGATSHGRSFALAIGLNIVFVVTEFTYGVIAESTALMADAGHNLSDVLGLILAWGAAVLAKKQPSNRYTYGLRSTSILAALANGMLLLIACGGIGWEAVRRFAEPTEVAGFTVAVVAAIGIAINGFSAWLFLSGSKNDLNIRGAFLHMAADALVSLGVVIGGVMILYTGWHWIDPALSLVIVLVILVSTWGLLRDAIRLSLSAVPAHIDLEEVQHYLETLPGVAEVQDLHIWGMSTTETALTAHLVMPGGYPGDEFMDRIAMGLERRFTIHHCTVQVKQNSDLHAGCALESKNTR